VESFNAAFGAILSHVSSPAADKTSTNCFSGVVAFSRHLDEAKPVRGGCEQECFSVGLTALDK